MSDFKDMLERIEALTGLTGRDAAQVAFAFDPGVIPSSHEIVEAAAKLGFDVEVKHDTTTAADPATPIAEITLDPAKVMEEVYWLNPVLAPADDEGRVHIPKLGKAPDEIKQYEEFAGIVEQLPEDIALALVKIDLLEGKATFWVRDGANEIDRPIGPLDLRAYDDGDALVEAIHTLEKRINRVLAAPWN